MKMYVTLYTTNEIQILKLALPLLSPSLRPYAAILIKGRELHYCLSLLPQKKITDASLELSGLGQFLDQALPYCNPKQRELFLQLKNMKKTMEMFEKMRGMMELFGDDCGPDSGMDISSLFSFFAEQEQMHDVAAAACERHADAPVSNHDRPADSSGAPASDHNRSIGTSGATIHDHNRSTDTMKAVKKQVNDQTIAALLKNSLSGEQLSLYEKFKSELESDDKKGG